MSIKSLYNNFNSLHVKLMSDWINYSRMSNKQSFGYLNNQECKNKLSGCEECLTCAFLFYKRTLFLIGVLLQGLQNTE